MKIKNVLMIVAIGTVLTTGVSSCTSSKNGIEGTIWQRNDKVGSKLNIRFGEHGRYSLYFYSIRTQFDGEYTVSGDTVRIVDKYCGTSLPGMFKFTVKKNELHFQTIDDKLCERRKILSDDVWKPDSLFPVQSASAALPKPKI